MFTAHVCSDMKRNKRRNTKKEKSLDRVERGGVWNAKAGIKRTANDRLKRM